MFDLSVTHQKLDPRNQGGRRGNETLHCYIYRKPIGLHFNARVGRDFELWKGVLGRHGYRNCNDNRRLFLKFCSEHQLVITNTLLQQKDRFKATWRHPRPKYWHLLDYVLTRQQDTRDALHTKVMPNADCYTDHRLVRCKVGFNFNTPPGRKGPHTKKCKCTNFVTEG